MWSLTKEEEGNGEKEEEEEKESQNKGKTTNHRGETKENFGEETITTEAEEEAEGVEEVAKDETSHKREEKTQPPSLKVEKQLDQWNQVPQSLRNFRHEGYKDLTPYLHKGNLTVGALNMI